LLWRWRTNTFLGLALAGCIRASEEIAYSLGKRQAAILFPRLQPGLIRESQLFAQHLQRHTSTQLLHGKGITQQLQRHPLLNTSGLDGSCQNVVQVAISAGKHFIGRMILSLVALENGGKYSRKREAAL